MWYQPFNFPFNKGEEYYEVMSNAPTFEGIFSKLDNEKTE